MEHTDPYRLWYEALQRSDPEEWSQQCKDYLLEAQGLPWDEWWEAVGEHFDPVRREDHLTVQELDDKEHSDWWWSQFGDDEDLRLIYVNLLQPDAWLVEDFLKLVHKYREAKPGRPRFESHAPQFPLHRLPKLDVINTMLTCYDLKEAAKKEGVKKSLYKIGVEAGVGPAYVVQEGDNKGEADRKRRFMTIIVARHVERAEALIANASKGIFPSY